jgi:hypothetical protein
VLDVKHKNSIAIAQYWNVPADAGFLWDKAATEYAVL